MSRRSIPILTAGMVSAVLAIWSWQGFAQNADERPPNVKLPSVHFVSTEASEAWKPKPVSDARYRDIVDYNIFRSDRAALARKVNEKRNPKPVLAVAEAPVEAEPKDPDAAYVLVGIVLRGPQQQAFIEDREQGEILRVDVPGDFSAGRLESINTESVVYRVHGENRAISVGANFLNEMTDLAPVEERSRRSNDSSRYEDEQEEEEPYRRPRSRSRSDRDSPIPD